MKKFMEVAGPEDDEGIQQYLDARLMTRADMGRILVTFRAWPGPLFWAYCCFPLLLSTFLYINTPRGYSLLAKVGTAAIPVLMLIVPLLGIYAFERHRVCEHGLIVGFRRWSKYMIPWSTIDPGRVRVVSRISLLIRRPDILQTSPGIRVGLISSRGIVLNGLDDPLAFWNPKNTKGYQTPFMWWLLATRRPHDLLTAIEEAMVADGYPAQGMTARAEAQAFTATWIPAVKSPIPERDGFDPVIGVDGPLMD